jgi:hypothetical protein
VVEQKIDKEVLIAYYQVVLAANKGKANTKL